jgi:hypothetical protein
MVLRLADEGKKCPVEGPAVPTPNMICIALQSYAVAHKGSRPQIYTFAIHMWLTILFRPRCTVGRKCS